jgi:hypothetical protein
MLERERTLPVLAARAAAAASTAALAVALAAHLIAAARLRTLLGFTFPARLGAAAWPAIFTNNARLAAAPVAGALLLGLIAPGAGRTRARRALDACLGLLAAVNITIVGCAYGAWPARMAAYSLPYAPLELAGFATAAGVYLRSRRAQPPARELAAGLAAALLALAAAALIESTSPPL